MLNMRLLLFLVATYISYTSLAQTNVLLEEKAVLLHNQYRKEVNTPPLVWDAALAESAQQYANKLAKTKKFEHSNIKGIGENLWMGTKGYFTLEQMIKDWGDEKQLFVNKPCPQFSTNGKWWEVGHYTQIIWYSTQKVGCAIASNSQNDYLVCHYKDPGNVMGQKAY